MEDAEFGFGFVVVGPTTAVAEVPVAEVPVAVAEVPLAEESVAIAEVPVEVPVAEVPVAEVPVAPESSLTHFNSSACTAKSPSSSSVNALHVPGQHSATSGYDFQNFHHFPGNE